MAIHTRASLAIPTLPGATVRNTSRAIVLAILMSGPNAFAADSTKELSWSSVQLEGTHLQLVSPKDKDQTADLHFAKNGILSMTSCNKDTCVAPLTMWKIENNRLKTGYVPDEGAALIKATATQLTLRQASGAIVVYHIKSRTAKDR